MQLSKEAIRHTWYRLVGTSVDFTLDNIAFNAISIVTLILLLILLPVNAILGLYDIVGLVALLLVLQAAFYFYSRFRRKYVIAMICYAAVSYIALIYTFIFNAGSFGPAISLFFLTFQLLIAFTRKELHRYWFLFHLLVPVTLLLVEYFHPSWIPNVYNGRGSRFEDLLSSYMIILVGMYGVTIYLRNNYNKEKNIAENQLVQIEQQNSEIMGKNEELEELNRQKVKLFSIISHDLRSPLTTTVGLAEMLAEESLTEEERSMFQAELFNLSKRSLDMFTNLLAWASTQMEGVKRQLVPTNLKELADKVIADNRLIIDRKIITVKNLLTADSIVYADADMMELIVRNILQNAVKFTETSGLITIEADTSGNMYELAIRDNGVGMTGEQLSALFSLKTVSTYGTGNERGSGIGLVLCRDFARLMGGDIRAESVPDIGSTFFISVPKM